MSWPNVRNGGARPVHLPGFVDEQSTVPQDRTQFEFQSDVTALLIDTSVVPRAAGRTPEPWAPFSDTANTRLIEPRIDPRGATQILAAVDNPSRPSWLQRLRSWLQAEPPRVAATAAPPVWEDVELDF